MKVLQYDNKKEELKLRAENKNIIDFAGCYKKNYRKFISIMDKNNGIGLAAPQIGLNINMFVFKKLDNRYELVMNPTIIERSDETILVSEGCLSVKNILKKHKKLVRRHKTITVTYNSGMFKVKKTFKGQDAIVFQHEYDHLKGVLYIDKLEEVK